MRLGAAEALHVDLLAGDAADHLGAGDEDPAGAAHDHDVGQRRAVRGAAGRRAEHHRDLRHPAGGPDHRREDLADRVERDHALGEPGAAGVPQADHRHPLADREVDRVDDVPAALGAHRAAHPGGVGGERDHRRAVDLARARPARRSRPRPRDQAQRAAVEQRRAGAPPGRGSRRRPSSADVGGRWSRQFLRVRCGSGAGEDERHVVAAEAERVVQRGRDVHVARPCARPRPGRARRRGRRG